MPLQPWNPYSQVERQVAERTADLEQAVLALQASEHRYRTVVEDQTEIIARFIPGSYVYTFVSDVYCRFFGKTKEEMLGQTWHPQAVADDLPMIGTALATLSVVNPVVTVENRVYDATGAIRWMQFVNRGIFDEAGQLVEIQSVGRDITPLKHAEDELKALNAQLEQKVEERTYALQESQKQVLHAGKLSAIGMLSASIAHEFNNPLQGIMMILKGLKKWAKLDDKERELVDAAIGESERIKNLIRSLQDFNRPSPGRKTTMHVHHILDALILLQTSAFASRRIRVHRDYADDLPAIEAVPDQIKQVFLNLLTNACDACSRHQEASITISTRLAGNRISVAVKDTGAGIAPENIDQIFQPFFSTKEAVKGTGLGLSVSHGIVEAHGGEIRVESCLGEGTTFTVFLPIRSPDENPTPG